jgi:membrane-associated protein
MPDRAPGLPYDRAAMELIAMLWDLVTRLDVHLAAFVAAHGAWVYGLLFLIVFCETGLVITPFLPGDSLLFVAGAIAAAGGMEYAPLAGTLIAAALVGDNVNYAVGRWLGPRIFSRPDSKILDPKHLQRTHDFYDRYGGRTIVLARFVPIVRTYAPFVAGLGAMPWGKYIAWCVAGALVWVLSLTAAGYFFGNLAIVKQNLALVIVLIVLASVMPMGVEIWRGWRGKRNAGGLDMKRDGS